ncbi:hypothetical protein BKA80DRAFT_259092 [Phyllosticta citrichinensis]
MARCAFKEQRKDRAMEMEMESPQVSSSSPPLSPSPRKRLCQQVILSHPQTTHLPPEPQEPRSPSSLISCLAPSTLLTQGKQRHTTAQHTHPSPTQIRHPSQHQSSKTTSFAANALQRLCSTAQHSTACVTQLLRLPARPINSRCAELISYHMARLLGLVS